MIQSMGIVKRQPITKDHLEFTKDVPLEFKAYLDELDSVEN